MSRIIYYYQTFTSLKPLLVDNTVVTHPPFINSFWFDVR